MILEMRTCQVVAGKGPEFLGIYQDNGLHIITRYARLIGCWTKDSGVLNSLVFCGAMTILDIAANNARSWHRIRNGKLLFHPSCLIWYTRKVSS